MKTLFVFFLVALCSTLSYSQSKVPESVKATFNSMFPDAASVKWEMEDGLYEGSFKEHKRETSALLSAGGKIVQTETEIETDLLPQALKDYVSTHLAGREISTASRIERADGLITYEAEVNRIDYLFDAKGQFLRQEVEEDDDDEDN